MTGLVFQGELATLRVVLDVLEPSGIPAHLPEWFFRDELPDTDERRRRDDLDRRVAAIIDNAFGPVGLQTEPVRFAASPVTAQVHINTDAKPVTLDPATLFAALNQSVEEVKGPIRDYTDALMSRDARGRPRVEIKEARVELGAGALQPTDPTAPRLRRRISSRRPFVLPSWWSCSPSASRLSWAGGTAKRWTSLWPLPSVCS